MRPIEPTILVGTHVRLEPLEAAHAGDLASVAEPAFWEHMGGGPFEPGGFDAYVARARADRIAGTRQTFAVVERQGEAAIGVTCISDISVEHRRVEIGGTWYARSRWGGVTNPETKLLLLTYLFDDRGTERVTFKTGQDNRRSQQAIERLGATREGTLRRHMLLPSERWRDSVYYSILRDEWPEVNAGLLRRLAQRP